jgi:maltooligosyltrehalose trehalohydrolase
VRGIADTINRGWLYEGQIYPRTGRPRGKPGRALSPSAFVYCIQNHDQVGNRAFGERLNTMITLDAYCAASMLFLFLPMTPLLFMGQEWAASTPFRYFTDHEPTLGEAVARGRREEFADFASFSDPELREKIPSPQAIGTFEASKVRWEEQAERDHARVLELYHALLYLRRSDPVLRSASRSELEAEARGDVLVVRRALGADLRILCVNFGITPAPIPRLELEGGELLPVLASDEDPKGGVLAPKHAVILAGRAHARA